MDYKAAILDRLLRDPAWVHVVAPVLKDRAARLRDRADKELDPIKAAYLKGRLEEVKDLLAWPRAEVEEEMARLREEVVAKADKEQYDLFVTLGRGTALTEHP